jgi:hypothetical protein
MSKRFVLFSILVVIIFLLFRYCSSKPEEIVEEEKPVPLGVSQNSDAFNQLFDRLLQSYFLLKETFVAGDPSKINAAASALLTNADSLNINEIRGDTSGTIRENAKYFTATISGSATAIKGDTKMEDKLREFDIITDALWSLTRTVKYDRQKIYYQFCPMAFDNRGAYWLSDKRDVRNPYFAGKMTDCGEVADSVDYGKR